MRFALVMALLVYLCAGSFAAGQSRWQACLTPGVKETDLVSVQRSKRGGVSRLTVKARLQQLKARCRNGKLVSASRREIVLYRLVGCWGNPPMDYLEVLERQRQEIRELRKRHLVLEIPCNPQGLLIP